jgi:hypothetical protein
MIRRRKPSAFFAVAAAISAALVMAVPGSASAAAPNWFDCDSGEVCFYTGNDGTGQKCSFEFADRFWATCSWRDQQNVRSVWNRGTGDYTGVVYYKQTEYRDRAGCTKQGARGNLAGTYKLHSHQWTTGHCGN